MRALSQSQRSEVCVRQREGREALCQPPLDLPAGVFAVCQQQRTAGFVIVYCQNLQMFQMFQTRCSVWSLLAGSESVTRVIKAVETARVVRLMCLVLF